MLDIVRNIMLGPAYRARKNWKPARRPYIKDVALEDKLYSTGFATVGMLSPDEVEKLQSLYLTLHSISRPDGCMFSSHHSVDIEYRAKVESGMQLVLKPLQDNLFNDYKVALNSFLVKVSGPESAFALHQDHSAVDELQHSGITMWIPLQDTDAVNGCLWVIPQSHKMFSPYRGVGIPDPFDGIMDEALHYLVPIELKKGEILLFDNRTIHCSLENTSGADRIAVVSNIIPPEAKIVTCYRKNEKDSIELYEHDMDYTRKYDSFYLGRKSPTATSRLLREEKFLNPTLSRKGFIAVMKNYGIKRVSHPAVLKAQLKQVDINTPTLG